MFPNVINPEEIDLIVQSLKEFEIKDIGTKSWLEAHENLLKLNQQSVLEAATHQEEVVKELLIIQDKLPILIHEAYSIATWRLKVFPKLLESNEITVAFYIYTVLYHELIAVSLLEIVLYHESSCESLGDMVIDLIDYCVNLITQLIGLCHSGYNQKKSEDASKKKFDTSDEMRNQRDDIIFNIGMKSITILSFLSDKISSLSISAARRMTQTHDVPSMMSELLAIRPWMRRIKGFEKYIDGKWISVEGDEILKVAKTEAQAWFCLRSIMFHRETFENYEITSFRQRELGKCSGLINDIILDQLPPLAELKQFLCTLQLSKDTKNTFNNLVLEVIPEIKDKIIEKAKKTGWKSIIERHKKLFVDMSENDVVETAKRLTDAYNFEFMVHFDEHLTKSREENKPKKFCSTCQKPAEQKCSRCEVVFYCCRECQVKDWINHKEKCYQFVE